METVFTEVMTNAQLQIIVRNYPDDTPTAQVHKLGCRHAEPKEGDESYGNYVSIEDAGKAAVGLGRIVYMDCCLGVD